MEVVLVLRTHMLTHISNDENIECYIIIFLGTNARQLFIANSLLIF